MNKYIISAHSSRGIMFVNYSADIEAEDWAAAVKWIIDHVSNDEVLLGFSIDVYQPEKEEQARQQWSSMVTGG